MTKVTIIKKYRNQETLRELELSVVVRKMKQQIYEVICRELQETYSLEAVQKRFGNKEASGHPWKELLPKICFSAVVLNRNKQRIMKAYNGLVLLEVNNLGSSDEAEAVRKSAGLIPQTMLAFIGASGLSVKIVCRGELFDGGLPSSDDDIRRFHINLHEKARLAYNMQLGVTIEKLEPELMRSCHISSDAGIVFNEHPQPFYVDCSDVAKAVQPIIAKSEERDYLLPGTDNYHAMRLIYEFCLTKANDDVTGITEEEERTHLLLTSLAGYCQESGIPMAIAQRLALFNHRLGKEPDVVRKVFENAYREEHEKQYRRRKNITKPLKNIPSETLLMMKVDMFLNANYELRKNVMRGVAEYRERTGLGFDFQDLTDEARNSITMRALSQGVKCWDKDISRYVNSSDIELYEPMNDFLDNLPNWDGKDRVEELARRIKTDYEEWPHLFHIWMRSMVAMWRGKGQLTGNALVPVLIGRQGCGKTSFCRILLPRTQREYYNDRINFKNESDLNLGLACFALINLDEFDKITQQQQIVLKYLVSTSDLKYRPPYGKAYSNHRRYASFIGTTNESTPLTDPSGSRRFICVTVEGDIDFTTPIEYEQLYAQLEHEVSVQRLRYHLTREEESALMEHNLQYQRLSQIGEQLLAIFEKPEGTSKTNPNGGKWMTLKEISTRLKKAFKSAYQEDEGCYIKIGNFLNRPEYKFENDRKKFGKVYWVKER
ncbi:MAG: hypothetical protein J6W03_07405 [Bacteroidaceae bacterium]|nr:hypothetical protein [Bacteroidaceae bacterium]